MFPELQSCWAWSAQGWLLPGLLHWGFCCWVTLLYITEASSSACCYFSFSSSSKNIPSSDLGHLRCENCSTHFFVSIVVKLCKGSTGVSGGVFRPDVFGLLAFFSPFCSSQTPGFQSSSSGPAAVIALEGRKGWDPYWKWNKQSDSLSTVG